jgi:hypothetical protein
MEHPLRIALRAFLARREPLGAEAGVETEILALALEERSLGVVARLVASEDPALALGIGDADDDREGPRL